MLITLPFQECMMLLLVGWDFYFTPCTCVRDLSVKAEKCCGNFAYTMSERAGQGNRGIEVELGPQRKCEPKGHNR